MAQRCPDSWRLIEAVERQLRLARLDCIPDEEHAGYREAMSGYRAHFRQCVRCRAWVDEWEKGTKRENQN